MDGIYTSDPVVDKNALRWDHLSYEDVQSNNIDVMDETAITLCKENDIPVVILSILKSGNILKAILGDSVGTLVDCQSTNEVNGPGFRDEGSREGVKLKCYR